MGRVDVAPLYQRTPFDTLLEPFLLAAGHQVQVFDGVLLLLLAVKNT